MVPGVKIQQRQSEEELVFLEEGKDGKERRALTAE